MSWLVRLPAELLRIIILDYASLKDVCHLDIAMSERVYRMSFLNLIRSFDWSINKSHWVNIDGLTWLRQREIQVVAFTFVPNPMIPRFALDYIYSFTKLRRMKVICSNFYQLDYVENMEVGVRCLEVLDLSECAPTDDLLEALIRGCHNLTCLDIGDAKQLTERSSDIILETTRRLRELHVATQPAQSIVTTQLLMANPHLERLTCIWPAATNRTLLDFILSGHSPCLKICALLSTSDVGAMVDPDIFKRCSNLQTFFLSNAYTCPNSDWLCDLDSCIRMEDLTIHPTPANSNVCGLLSKMPNLKALYLIWTEEQSLCNIAAYCPQLQRLHLSYIGHADEGVQNSNRIIDVIERCTHMKALSLGADFREAGFCAAVYQALSLHANNLEELRVFCSNVDLNCIAALKRCAKLRILSLREFSKENKDLSGIIEVAENCKCLRQLEMASFIDLHEDFLCALVAARPEIDRLILVKPLFQMTDTYMTLLSKFTNLKILVVNDMGIKCRDKMSGVVMSSIDSP